MAKAASVVGHRILSCGLKFHQTFILPHYSRRSLGQFNNVHKYGNERNVFAIYAFVFDTTHFYNIHTYIYIYTYIHTQDSSISIGVSCQVDTNTYCAVCLQNAVDLYCVS